MPFNLVDEPWLVVRPVGGGHPVERSLLDVLLEADRFEDLVVDVPTQKPALLRQVLLPIVLHALGRPGDHAAWVGLFQAGAFDEAQRAVLRTYLDEHHDLFDLLHPVHPFAQVAGLCTARDETKGSALLVATAASGNNVPLFASRTDGDPLELTPAQAAHWLLHTHCWDTAAIKTGVVGDPQTKDGKTTGNPTGPLGQLGVVVPTGRTLYETLLLNIPTGPAVRSDDLPQWQRRAPEGRAEDTLSIASPVWQTRAAKGLLDLWTWQSRRIRLIAEDTLAGPRVTRVVIAAGDRLSETPEFEPHTTWSLTPTGSAARGGKNAGKKGPLPPRRPRRHQPGKAAWRGLDALLATARVDVEATKTKGGFTTSVLLDQLRARRTRLPADYPLQLELTGVSYGTQSATVDDVLFDTIPLPLTALGDDLHVHGTLLEVASQAEELAHAVNNLSADLRRAMGSDPIPWDKGQRPGELVLYALDPLVRRLLAGLRLAGDDFDTIERGQLAWEQLARRRTWEVAEQVFATAAPGAFAGRMVTKDGKERTYRLSTAEASLRRRLNEILVRDAQARKDLRQREDTALAATRSMTGA